MLSQSMIFAVFSLSLLHRGMTFCVKGRQAATRITVPEKRGRVTWGAAIEPVAWHVMLVCVCVCVCVCMCAAWLGLPWHTHTQRERERERETAWFGWAKEKLIESNEEFRSRTLASLSFIFSLYFPLLSPSSSFSLFPPITINTIYSIE